MDEVICETGNSNTSNNTTSSTQAVYNTDITTISRRGFIQATAFVGASLALLPYLSQGETILKAITPGEAQEKLQAASTMTTGVRDLGFCANGWGTPAVVVDSMNNKIVRTRPLHYDWQYNLSDLNFDSWAITAANGKTFTCPTKTLVPPYHLAYKKSATSLNRVLYPLKRVDWNPGGPTGTGYNPQNRGLSKWVRISWDEALTYVYDEITRIKTTYGTTALFAVDQAAHGECNNIHGRGHIVTTLNAVAGTPIQILWRDPDSWEGWYWGTGHMWGPPTGQPAPNSLYMGAYISKNLTIVDAIQNCELGLFWSGDPETTTWGWTSMSPGLFCYWFKQAGMHVIYIQPALNYGAMVHADKWIPILPNTDYAMHLAIAYTWITEGTYDADFISTHTFGFDETSTFPAGAPPNSSFKSYVMGISDGVPKTPKWAESKCGVPSRIIKALAREWASKRTSIFHSNGGGMIRGPYSTEPARGEIALLSMQGIGKPGVDQICCIEWGPGGPTPNGLVPVSAGAAVAMPGGLGSMAGNGIGIAQELFAQSIVSPPQSWYGGAPLAPPLPNGDQMNYYTYPPQGGSRIHMIYSDYMANLPGRLGGYSLIAAYRDPSIEFILFDSMWLENDALYADLILPVSMGFENDVDLNADTFNGQLWGLLLQNQCIQPPGETKSDLYIAEAILDKFDQMNGTNLSKTLGVVSTAQAAQTGFMASGAQNYISWDDFQKKQFWLSPVDPKWATDSGQKGMGYYYQTNSPMPTPSGKIEFFCQDLFDKFPTDDERPPVPHWIENGVTHQEALSSPRAAQYPLLLTSNHVRWRVHCQQDDISWTREIPTCKVTGPDGYKYEPIWIHPIDAAQRGIQNGDILQMYNDRGAVLGGAIVTERVMPGAVWQDHAARLDPINDQSVAEGIDRGGSNNLIAPHVGISQNCTAGLDATGFLVEIKKADMAALMAQYPNGFHPFDPASGPYPAQTNVTTTGST